MRGKQNSVPYCTEDTTLLSGAILEDPRQQSWQSRKRQYPVTCISQYIGYTRVWLYTVQAHLAAQLGLGGVTCVARIPRYVARLLLVSKLRQCELQRCQLVSYALICFSIFDGLHHSAALMTRQVENH